jgi:FHS family L-fucose permease-like MFS transporter
MSHSTTHHSSDTIPVIPIEGRIPFSLVTALFFIWGTSNNLTDILVQQFRKSFELTAMEAQLVQTAVFFGYFCMAIPAALLMERRGYKVGIVTGLLLFASGTFAFWPAALIGRYTPFLIALFLVGCGSAVLETAANSFISQAGPTQTAERRLTFAQIFNPLGTIAGVLLGTYFIFSGVELTASQMANMQAAGTYQAHLHAEIMRVVPVYVGLACVVLLWAALIWRARFPSTADSALLVETSQHGLRDLLKFPHLWMAVGAQFFYCGAQVSTWSALIPYLKQYTSLTERDAAYWLMANLVAFAFGRIAASWAMRWVRPYTLIGLYALLNIGLLCGTIVYPGKLGGILLIASSFFMAPMFPTIFASGVRGLGAMTKLGGSLIVMAVVGAAVIPPVLGYVAKLENSYALAYLVTAICYAIVAIYAFVSTRKSARLSNTPFATTDAAGRAH